MFHFGTLPKSKAGHHWTANQEPVYHTSRALQSTTRQNKGGLRDNDIYSGVSAHTLCKYMKPRVFEHINNVDHNPGSRDDLGASDI